MGSDDRRRRCASTLPGFAEEGAGAALLLPPRLRVVYTAVFDEEVRVAAGRGVLLSGVPGRLPSFRGSGESLRMDRAEGARAAGRSPEPVRRMGSAAANGPSGPG